MEIDIGEGSVIGAGSVIMGDCKVGSWAAVRIRSFVDQDVPDNCELSGNPAIITNLIYSPLGNMSTCVGSDLATLLIASWVRSWKALWNGFFVYLAVNSYQFQILIPFCFLALAILDGLFWGFIIRVSSRSGTVRSRGMIEYNNWQYFCCQRLRLIIGRTSNFTLWGFTYYQKLLLWYLGVNISADVEVAGPLLPHFQIPFSEVFLNEGSTLTSNVWIGEEYWINGVWHVSPVSIGQNSFVGNMGTVSEGSTPSQSTVASLALVNKESRASKIPNSVAVGNPAFYTQQSVQFGWGGTSGNQFVFARYTRVAFELMLLAIECALTLVGQAVGLVVSALAFQFVGEALAPRSLLQWIGVVLIGKLASLTYGAATTLLFKHAVMGRFTQGGYRFFSPWFYARTFLYIMLRAWQSNELEYWGSSEWTNCVFRALGASVGRRVIIEDPGCLLEFDLVTIGDDCTLETGSILQPHSFEGRVMTCRPVTLRNGVLVGSGSLILSGADLHTDSLTECLTLVYKNQVLVTGRQVVGGDISPKKGSSYKSNELSYSSQTSESEAKTEGNISWPRYNIFQQTNTKRRGSLV
jgi:non-ribosomal peptide synthetase-like protein